MKENYPNYLPYQFHWRPQSVDWDSQLSHKKMKTMFLWNMSKSRRLTSTFFPDYYFIRRHVCFSFSFSLSRLSVCLLNADRRLIIFVDQIRFFNIEQGMGTLKKSIMPWRWSNRRSLQRPFCTWEFQNLESKIQKDKEGNQLQWVPIESRAHLT